MTVLKKYLKLALHLQSKLIDSVEQALIIGIIILNGGAVKYYWNVQPKNDRF